jgi:hypothetical protein
LHLYCPDSSTTGHVALNEHDDDIVYCCLVDWRETAHDDECIGSTNASTQSQGRGGGELH